LTNLLGEEGRGFYQTMETLDAGRISIGALSIGLAQAAFEESVRYAKQREAFGHKIADYQAIQWMIADAALEIDASRAAGLSGGVAAGPGQAVQQRGGYGEADGVRDGREGVLQRDPDSRRLRLQCRISG